MDKRHQDRKTTEAGRERSNKPGADRRQSAEKGRGDIPELRLDQKNLNTWTEMMNMLVCENIRLNADFMKTCKLRVLEAPSPPRDPDDKLEME